MVPTLLLQLEDFEEDVTRLKSSSSYGQSYSAIDKEAVAGYEDQDQQNAVQQDRQSWNDQQLDGVFGANGDETAQ